MVRLNNLPSTTLPLNTDGPQGCVLRPLLHTLFTHDCSPIHNTNIIKFADDTTVLGLIRNNDESTYREEVQHLAAWCTNNNLALNPTNALRNYPFIELSAIGSYLPACQPLTVTE